MSEEHESIRARNERLIDQFRRTEDEAICWQLVLNNLGMLNRVLISVLRHAPSEDEWQLGLIAAREAFEKWEPERATPWSLLRWKVMRAVESQEGRFGIRIQVFKQTIVKHALERERQRLVRGLEPSIEAICPQDMDSTTFAVAFLCGNRHSDGGSVNYLNPEDPTESILDQVTVEAESEDDAERKSVHTMIHELMPTLTERQVYVLERRFGMVGEPQSLYELGKDMALSRERVRQIEREALQKLREKIPSETRAVYEAMWERDWK